MAFFKIEFCLDTFFNNNLNCRDKLIIVAKNSILVVSLIFINEVSRNIIYNQLTIDKKIALSLFENFIFNFGKEIVIVIAWKVFKISWENNNNYNSYLNSIFITVLFAIGYGAVNVGQTLYTIWDTLITNFFPTFCIILTSNIITSGLRIVASSSLSYFFSDIATKWKNNRCCQRTLIDETALLQEVVSVDTNSYGSFATTPMVSSNSIQFNREDIIAINNDIYEHAVPNNNSVRISNVG